jgi:hypothetical protein
MKRNATYYRGYRIEGERKDDMWLLRIGPRRPDLPIMRFASFRVMRSTWDEALTEAGQRIDAVLAGREFVRERLRPTKSGSLNHYS